MGTPQTEEEDRDEEHRLAGATSRSGFTEQGLDDAEEYSPNSKLSPPDSSGKALLVRDKRGDKNVGDEDDEEEENAIVAEGGRSAWRTRWKQELTYGAKY